jgi:hypothetical protein
MSRVKVSKTATTADEGKKSKEWPAVVYFWAFGLAIFGYAAARVGLNGFPHPYHWMTGIIGGVVGIPLGWLWYRWRGDIF